MNYTVKQIDSCYYGEWILKKHYAKRMPSISYAYGLFDDKKQMCGVVTYGTQSSGPIKKVFNPYVLVELNRLCVNEGLEKNSLSFFVSSPLKMLPKPCAVVSYADTEFSAKRTDWKVKGLEHLHGSTIADISRGVENRAQYMRDKFGDSFYLKDRSRKHRYFYFLGSKRDVKNMMALLPYEVEQYPKGDNVRYDCSYKPFVRINLF